jgi:hypothetical protein
VPAGDYRVEWEGTGTSVKASIIQGKTVIVTAPATMIEEKTQYDQAIETRPGQNNGQILDAIEWKSRSLRFNDADSVSPTIPAGTAK